MLYKTIQTITTIELANVCSLSCRYCINRFLVKHPDREPGIMSDEVFEASCDILSALVQQDTQREVNVNGNGESCLDPQLPARIRTIKEIVGSRVVQFCTNGTHMTPILARRLKDTGIDRVHISLHDAWSARKAAEYLGEAGHNVVYALGVLQSPHSWCEQLPVEDRFHHVPQNMQCDPLIEGRGYISKEGNISPCCYDYRNLGKIGSVFDSDILERKVKPYALCETCHQIIPDELANDR